MKKAIIVGISHAFFALGISLAQSNSINPPKPDTVCHVLQNLSLYQGKIIQVRGIWHGSFIEEECDTQIQTANHKWPNSILLIYTENLAKGDEPVNWIFGPTDYDPKFRELMRFKEPVYATIIGRLDVGAQLSPSPNGGPSFPIGYGHLGYYPARIVMKEIRDISGSQLREESEEIEMEYVPD